MNEREILLKQVQAVIEQSMENVNGDSITMMVRGFHHLYEITSQKLISEREFHELTSFIIGYGMEKLFNEIQKEKRGNPEWN